MTEQIAYTPVHVENSADSWVVSPQRVFWLSVLSFSLYQYIWLYRNWARFRGMIWEPNIRPGWRTLGTLVPLLGLILIYQQLAELREHFQRNDAYVKPFSPFLLAVLASVAMGLSRALDHWEAVLPFFFQLNVVHNLIVIGLPALPFWIVQHSLNAFWRTQGHTPALQPRLSLLEKLALSLGLFFWGCSLLLTLGQFLPEG